MKFNGTALCFNFEDEKFAETEKVCRKCGIRIKRVEKSDFDKPVGELCGFVGLTPEEGPTEFDNELMLISVFSGGDLNKLLKALHTAGIDIPLKAALTETNKTWLAAALCKQIKLEHEQMKKTQG